MIFKKVFFSVLWTVVISGTLSAQPALLPYGCHYLKQKSLSQPNGKSPDELLFAGNSRSDSLDVLNYDIFLDLTGFTQGIISGACEVLFTSKVDNISVLPLDLLALTVDSVKSGDNLLTFDHVGPLLNVNLPVIINTGDSAAVTVFYHGHPWVDPTGFGGFDFEGNICYNLGIGFSADPLPVGRTWFPCFDNFVERATFDFSILTNATRKGYAVGTFLDATEVDNNLLSRYRMAQPLPTYLVGVAASDYTTSYSTHQGVSQQIPLELTCAAGDTAQMKVAFDLLGESIDELEAWYGPYFWEKIGYILTPVGAMEHCTNIHYPGFIIDQGPDFGQNKLMAHELAHHWWGNITTLTTPSDMWIKEGNAEYGAHLFFEHVYGKDYFRGVVKDNQLNVIRNAHKDDGGIFHPLSPMPFEFTYGTHTYDKGAAVMHTLRGYMGDTLFSQGMRSILQAFPYQTVDAAQFRDQLIANTGLISLNSFFDDWIFGTGFAAYELDSLHLVPGSGGSYTANLFIQQKGYATSHFHTNVPLEITFFDQNWNTYEALVTVTGEYSEVAVNVPFQPVYQIINEKNRLNLGQLQNTSIVREDGDMIDGEHCSLATFQVLATTDSALVSATHFYVAPDPAPANAGFRMSNSHYWNVGGIFPAGIKMKASVEYRGAGELDLDHDLTALSEDSLILVWRPDRATPWSVYPYYAKLTFSPDNGFGYVRIDTLYPGDYAFANDLDLSVGTVTASNELPLTVYPNPADEYIVLEGEIPFNEEVKAILFDNTGKKVLERRIQPESLLIHEFFLTKDLPAGIYSLQLQSDSGNYRQTVKVMVE
jgi:hypothetical protein